MPPALACLAAALLAGLLTGPAARLARRRGLVVRSRSGETAPTLPLLGGLALLAPAALLLAGEGFSRPAALALLAALAVAFLVGLADDRRTLAPPDKILGTALAGLLLAAPLLFQGALLPALLAVAVVVAVTQATNIVDGQDGVAAAAGLVGAAGAWIAGVEVPLAAVLAGALLAFLAANRPPARLYLGDAGSLGLGVLLAFLALAVGAVHGPVRALGLVAYPLGDALYVTLRRLFLGKPPWVGDRLHSYHELSRRLGGPGRALVAVLLFAAVLLALSFVPSPTSALGAMAAAWALLALFLRVRRRDAEEEALPARVRALYRQRRETLEALAGSKGPDAVRAVLERDLPLLGVEGLVLGALHVEGGAESDVARTLDTPAGEAMWWAPMARGPWADERDRVVEDLLRTAGRALRRA